ncbi:hypothetical protein RB195_006761 [Necator americanus]|uniref:Bestrophin homolog n=1 Tax=Necator americanus TaxID=51031 RepID=A0ABR1BVV1_NECAM
MGRIHFRWWKVFMTIPWPDNLGLLMCSYIRTRSDEKDANTDRIIRRTVMRYFILCYVLVFRDISERIRRRFPTYNHLVPTLMTEAEKERIEGEDIKRVYWMPIEWAMQLLKKCYSRHQIDEYHFAVLCQNIAKYREMMHNLLSFDWINVPLVYTQVVHICILAYFGIICFANQPIREEGRKAWIHDFVIPGYAIYEFIFFVGWLKVAQVMLNPFGMDEDDFEIDMLVERNLQVGYSYVDTMYDRLPPLVYVGVTSLPHTKASMALISKVTPMVGSVANVKVPRAEQRVISKEDVELIRKLVGPKFGRRFADYVARNRQVEKNEKREQASESLKGTTITTTPVSQDRRDGSRKSRAVSRTCISHEASKKVKEDMNPWIGDLDATQSSSVRKQKPTPEPSRIRTVLSTQRSKEDLSGDYLARARSLQPAPTPSFPYSNNVVGPPDANVSKPTPFLDPSFQNKNIDMKKEKPTEKSKSKSDIIKGLKSTQRTMEKSYIREDNEGVSKSTERKNKIGDAWKSRKSAKLVQLNENINEKKQKRKEEHAGASSSASMHVGSSKKPQKNSRTKRNEHKSAKEK